MDKACTLVHSAMAVLIDRIGGEMEYTQSEFASVMAKHGEYVITGRIDKSGPGEPIFRVKIEPSNKKTKMPVA